MKKYPAAKRNDKAAWLQIFALRDDFRNLEVPIYFAIIHDVAN